MSTAGTVKRDPDTGSVAVRTHFDEANPQLAPMAWLVSTIALGPRHASSTEVAEWETLYTPPTDD